MNRRAHLAIALFCVFQGLYALTASGRVDRVADEFEVYLQAESLFERRSLAIPQVVPNVYFGTLSHVAAPTLGPRCGECAWARSGDAWRCQVCGAGALPYAPYGPATAYLSLAHHGGGRALAALTGVPRSERRAWTALVAALTSLASATWAALAVVALFRAALALGADPRRAALAAALLGGATALWPYGTHFFSEAQAAALFGWAVAWQLEGRRRLAAGAAALLLLLKVAHVILLPALFLLAAGGAASLATDDARRALARRLAPLAAAVCAAGAVHAFWNVHRYGSVFEFGYDLSEYLRPGEAARPFLLAAAPRGVFGLLFSPGKSLLLFAPPLLLALARAPAFARAHPAAARAAAAALALPLLFYGSYQYWEGGYCFGPRFLVPALPLLLLPLIAGPPPRRAALAFCLTLGVAVQVLGVSVSYLEDQAGGMRAPADVARGEEATSTYYRVYPPDTQDVARGRPLNVYRLDYNPLASYPQRLWAHLTPREDAPGELGGLDLLPLHLARARARPGGEALPRWAPWAVPTGALVLLGLGLWLGRAGLARAPAAPDAGAPPGSPPPRPALGAEVPGRLPPAPGPELDSPPNPRDVG